MTGPVTLPEWDWTDQSDDGQSRTYEQRVWQTGADGSLVFVTSVPDLGVVLAPNGSRCPVLRTEEAERLAAALLSAAADLRARTEAAA
jgi:hypothetical protein